MLYLERFSCEEKNGDNSSSADKTPEVRREPPTSISIRKTDSWQAQVSIGTCHGRTFQ